jgi:hypothetical protein
MTKQKVFTPDILPCSICGSSAGVIDWNYNLLYKVYCDNNHSTNSGTGCITINRAVHKWNNKQKDLNGQI